jgi:anti-sigma regulatory factor (Ser/Thr protein kinase)
VAESVATQQTLGHFALFYRGEDDYVTPITRFLREGLEAGEPTFVAVPAANAAWLRDALGPDASRVRFADMTTIGRNPAWIIPRVREFIDEHSGHHVRYVGEPIWAARTADELREATRHEALINLAFAGADVDILCPYDTARLDPAVIADARQTHPELLCDGLREASAAYPGPLGLPSSCSSPLPRPPHDAMSFTYTDDLSEVRALVEKHARDAGLTDARAADLVLAVSEVAANTLRHARSPGSLTIWHDADEIVCEVHDEGVITDPLAGRRRPAPDAPGGHGLWLVHQVCDLVELRSDSGGTTVRMHMAVDRN